MTLSPEALEASAGFGPPVLGDVLSYRALKTLGAPTRVESRRA